VYEDAGKLEKMKHVVERIKAICEPWWQKRAKRLQNKALERRIW